MLYYDPFHISEEENLEEEEKAKCHEQLTQFIQHIQRVPQQQASSTSSRLNHLELTLDLPMELTKWDAFADQFIEIARTNCHTQRLSRVHVTHWRLGDSGIPSLIQILQSNMPERIECPSCGLSSIGVTKLLQSLTPLSVECSGQQDSHGPMIPRYHLDFSRNALRRSCQDWMACLSKLPIVTLNLSCTGLSTVSSLSELFRQLDHHPTLRRLDLYGNMDSLVALLEVLIPHLSTSLNFVEKILVAPRGASSSTCMDYSVSNLDVLRRLSAALQDCPNLFCLGPISILPLDQESNSTTQRIYEDCRRELDEIDFVMNAHRASKLIRQCESSLSGATGVPWLLSNIALWSSSSYRSNTNSKNQNLNRMSSLSIQFYVLREAACLIFSAERDRQTKVNS